MDKQVKSQAKTKVCPDCHDTKRVWYSKLDCDYGEGYYQGECRSCKKPDQWPDPRTEA